MHYGELIRKIEEHEGKKYLMIDDYMLDLLWDKIEVLGIENFDNAKVLIDTGDNLLDDITFKNVAILIICVIHKRWW